MSSFCQITILDNLLLWNPWRKFPQKNKVNPQAEDFQLQVNFTTQYCVYLLLEKTQTGEKFVKFLQWGPLPVINEELLAFML